MYIDTTERINNKNQPEVKKAKYSKGASFVDAIETLLQVDAVDVSLPKEEKEKKQSFNRQTKEEDNNEDLTANFSHQCEIKSNLNILV